jgi:hypothetical protein
MILYRPIGLRELSLLAQSGFRAWPPRLPHQPIECFTGPRFDGRIDPTTKLPLDLPNGGREGDPPHSSGPRSHV